ncbi:RidA family protein [Cohnella rhizosphaerae]|uniref:Rid family hydrolase n=1 Tax=Cohnella rhizosphaerae TaxID=1457232 RepID=A0A9X4L4N6_9BACL|nr:Rid family hydrolase [Cohnella rhizosphaerae]MDG0813397.1 Rid family hydrolase [Cohnella rhizosphaerae]
MSECIQAGQAPQFPLPFSHAVRSGDHVYVSGQVGVDPATLVKDGDTIESQTVRAFRNIELILNAAGLTLDHVVKVNAILSKGEDSPGLQQSLRRHHEGAISGENDGPCRHRRLPGRDRRDRQRDFRSGRSKVSSESGRSARLFAVAGLLHETNTFAPFATEIEAFSKEWIRGGGSFCRTL